MNRAIKGLHHITAIASNARRNVDLYTRVLGLRLVKKTVNFDDPGTYHFYYGNETGEPGTILTFFPWEGIGQGRTGTGMATEIHYAVPKGSLEFWEKRLKENGVVFVKGKAVFDGEKLKVLDPDGLILNLVESDDEIKPWKSIPEQFAVKGFRGVVLTVNRHELTAKVLTDILGYDIQKQESNYFRLVHSSAKTAGIIDIMEQPLGKRGVNAAGTNHHIAFRVENEQVLMEYREKLESTGLSVTPMIDRNYFYSVYFREPGGVLFEIATENPGFMVDENIEDLGKALKLPAQYEPARTEIEKLLPKID